MNAISLTHHLLLKDLRHQQAWLALLWGIAIALPFVAQRGYAMFVTQANYIPPISAYQPYVYSTYAFFALLMLGVARVIRLDAPGRESHFLATRPVPQGVLLASKVLFIVLFLLVPVWVVRLGMLWRMGIPVDRTDVALLLAETTIHAGAILAVATLLSLFVRHLAAILVIMAAGAVGAGMFGEYLRNHWYFQKPIWTISLGLIASRFLVFYICIIVTVAAVSILRYRRKSFAVPAGVLAAGLLLGIAAWISWPCDLSLPFSGEAAAKGPLPPALREGIQLTLTGTEGRDNNIVQESGDVNGEISYFFNHDVSLKGVEPPYFAMLADYHAVATLKSGRTIVSAYDDVNSHGGWGGMSDALRAEMAGVLSKEKVQWDVNHFEIFNYFPGRYANEDLDGARIKGTITLQIDKAVLVGTAPFRTGSWVDLPRKHFVFRKAAATRYGMTYDMATTAVSSVLRGDKGALHGFEEFSMLVFNPAKEEYLGSFGSGGGGPGQGYFFQVDHMNETLDMIVNGKSLSMDLMSGQNGKFPLDWGDGAQAAFFTATPCGRITLPYEIASKDLRH